jgi:hypothetical protein
MGERFKKWFTQELQVVLIFAVIAVVIGFASFHIASSLTSLVVALIVLIGSAMIVKKLLKVKEGAKWWLNPIVVYLFIWIIVWAIFYNLAIL